MERLSRITVKWNEEIFQLDVEGDYTIGDLKYVICKKTKIKPFLQKFLNLNLRSLNVDDTCTLSQLNITNEFVLIMTAIDENQPQPSTSGTSTQHTKRLQQESKHPLQEIDKLIEQRANIQVPVSKPSESPRPEKNLMVLDIDLTIFDCTEEGRQQGHRAIRPYLHEFLTSVYADYDIMIWSATNRLTIDCKLELLGITSNENYKILSCMDRSHMISIPLTTSEMVEVKSLPLIWSRYKEYNKKNTVICDDQDRNFFFSQENGILVDRYFYENYEQDKELLYLAKYLKYLSSFSDFSLVGHSCWRECVTINE